MFCLNTVVHLLYYILIVDSSQNPFLNTFLSGVNIHHPIQPTNQNMDVSENSGFSPQIIHLYIGFSIIFTIHSWGPTPIFGNTHVVPNFPPPTRRSFVGPSKGREIGCLRGAMSEEVAESQGDGEPHGNRPGEAQKVGFQKQGLYINQWNPYIW